ncbi:YcxB family protein [Lachnospiraceae bacterium LCP25S3_G4]
MTIKLQVKMTTKAMFDFMLYHTYHHFSGLFGSVFGVVTLILGVRSWRMEDYSSGLILFMFAFLFLIFTPFTLRSKAKKQVEKTPMFQEEIHYEFNEDGIITSQGDAKTSVAWKELVKAVSTNHSIIIYITRVRAFIFPKEALGEEYPAVVEMISTHMPPAKVNIRHVK